MLRMILKISIFFIKGLFTYYVITAGEGGSSMITLHVIVTWVSTVKVITERGKTRPKIDYVICE